MIKGILLTRNTRFFACYSMAIKYYVNKTKTLETDYSGQTSYDTDI